MIQFQRVTLIFKEAPSAFVVIVDVGSGDVVGVVDVGVVVVVVALSPAGTRCNQPTSLHLDQVPSYFPLSFFTRVLYNKTYVLRNYNLISARSHLSSKNIKISIQSTQQLTEIQP